MEFQLARKPISALCLNRSSLPLQSMSSSSKHSPQPVERRAKSKKDGCWVGLLLFPATAFGAICFVCFQLTLGIFGIKTEGQVTGKEVEYDKGGPYYKISCEYKVRDQNYAMSARVSEAYGDEISLDGQVRVTYLGWFPDYTARLLPPGHRFPASLPFWIMFSVLWCLLSIPIVRFLAEERKEARKNQDAPDC